MIHFDQAREGITPPPKGKHVFGTVQVGERGQIVIPKKARDLFGIKQGDTLIVLGDTNPGSQGIALMQSELFLNMAQLLEAVYRKDREDECSDR